MTSILVLLVLAAALVSLVSYARHDRFAGPAVRGSHHDELGHSDPTRLAF
jgi:hypothetical protein